MEDSNEAENNNRAVAIKQAHVQAKRQREETAEIIRLKRLKEQKRIILNALEKASDLESGILVETSDVSDDTKKWFIDRGFTFEAFYLPSEDYYHSQWRIKYIP